MAELGGGAEIEGEARECAVIEDVQEAVNREVVQAFMEGLGTAAGQAPAAINSSSSGAQPTDSRQASCSCSRQPSPQTTTEEAAAKMDLLLCDPWCYDR